MLGVIMSKTIFTSYIDNPNFIQNSIIKQNIFIVLFLFFRTQSKATILMLGESKDDLLDDMIKQVNIINYSIY